MQQDYQAMNLEEIATLIIDKKVELQNFVRSKEKELEQEVRKYGKKLRFKSVTKEIKEKSGYLDYLDRYFVEELEIKQVLEFMWHQGWYSAYLDRKKLVLKSGNIEITRFEGKKVERFYKNIASGILKAREEYINNLPF